MDVKSLDEIITEDNIPSQQPRRKIKVLAIGIAAHDAVFLHHLAAKIHDADLILMELPTRHSTLFSCTEIDYNQIKVKALERPQPPDQLFLIEAIKAAKVEVSPQDLKKQYEPFYSKFYRDRTLKRSRK